MYFATGQYPALRGRTRKERNLLVAAALRKHNKWAGRRCLFIVGACALTAAGLAGFDETMQRPDWFDVVAPVSFGLLFYCYLLWEINGPVHAAVSTYTAESTDADGPRQC